MADIPQPSVLACLFVDATSVSENTVGPLSRFGAGTLLDQQLAALHAGNIHDVAILADRLVPGLDEILGQWRGGRLNIVVFLDRFALFDWAGEHNMLLILAHNLVATPATLANATAHNQSTLFVRDAATSDERHERIDLNDRWTGIAVLPTQYLAELPDLAEDWSLQSALLRHAVQHGVDRETIAIGPAAPMQSEIIVDTGDVDRWLNRTMQQHFDQEAKSAIPFRRWIGLPLSRAILPILWDSRAEAAQILEWGRYALLVVVAILALLQWPVAALCLLLPIILLEEISRQNAALSARVQDDALFFQVYSAIWFALPAAALMSSGELSQLNAFLLGATAALSVAVSAAVRPTDEKWVVARQEAVVLALGCTVAGLSLTTAALMTSFAVLVSGFWRPIWSRLKAI